MLREMKIEDYEEVFQLWNEVTTLVIHIPEDTQEEIERFLKRNPGSSYVAVEDGKIIGTILCGQDGRRGCIYHMCVAEKYRNRGIGSSLVEAVRSALRAEGIHKIALLAFVQNETGNLFWKKLGWNRRTDINYYDKEL